MVSEQFVIELVGLIIKLIVAIAFLVFVIKAEDGAIIKLLQKLGTRSIKQLLKK